MAFGDCNSDSDCNGNYLNGNCSIVDWNLYFPSICQFLGIFYHLGPGQGPGPGQLITYFKRQKKLFESSVFDLRDRIILKNKDCKCITSTIPIIITITIYITTTIKIGIVSIHVTVRNLRHEIAVFSKLKEPVTN